MGFLSSTVVVVAMTIVSACLGTLAFLVLRFDLDTSAILAVAALAVMVLLQLTAWRGQDRRVTSRGFEDVNRAVDRLAREFVGVANRVAALEAAGTTVAAKEIPALRTEVDTLRRDLADMAAFLAEQVEAGSAAVRPAPATAPALSEEGPRRGRFAALPRVERIALVAAAIDAGRIELLLQPVVTLPQRKIRWYEVLARLKTEHGEVMLPDDVAPIAEEGGLSARLDRELILRSVQLVRRLQTRNREAGLLIDIAPASLSDGAQFGEIVDFLSSNQQVASSITFEVPQAAYRAFGAIELEAMSAISSRGFRFALDNVRDLRLDGRELADRHFRFVKIPADVLLGKAGALPADIHPADLAGLLARYGIDLIADRIEAEATVVDLLDYDVRFGQGHLFSPPRPLRADILGAEPPSPRRAAS